MDIDLELANYDLNDLLKLFNLNSNFGADELKQVKRTVVQIHPDKSGLDKKFFLFYCKAYRAVKNIYEYRNKRDNQLNNSNAKIEYLAESEDDAGKRHLIENLQKKSSEEFNKWFNKTFEKINITDESKETGYGDWFQSNEDIDTTKATKNQMHEKISKRKEELSAITKVHHILGAGNTPSQSYNELDTSCPESYGSDIFSKLPFEDLKKAHTETVVPVGTNDYNKVLKFKNLEALRRHRNNQETNPMTDTESKKYLEEQNKNEDDVGVNLAYKLTRQDEEAKEANAFWWNSLRSLK
jgi:hypothetical protein